MWQRGALPVLAVLTGCQAPEAPTEAERMTSSRLEWSPAAVLGVSDPTNGNMLGSSLAISGNTVIAGAPFGDMEVPGSGAAYVFERNPSGWGTTEVKKLVATGLAENDEYGASVGIDTDHACVGAPQVIGPQESGRVFVYDRASSWSLAYELDYPSFATNGGFGVACDVDGDTIVASDWNYSGTGFSGGAVLVFERVGTAWFESAVLHQGGLTGSANLGNSVAISGDTVVAGTLHEGPGANLGGAYVFERSGGAWQNTAVLQPSTPPAGGAFAHSVAVSGSVIAVGAPYFDGGAAYVYAREGGQWVEKQILTVPNGFGFGFSVAVHGKLIAVGSHAGVFVYERASSGSWSPVAGLPTPSVLYYTYGHSVALASATLMVATPYETLPASPPGTLYAYDMSLGIGDGCDVSADCQEGFCVDGVCCEEVCGGASDDCVACSVAAGASVDGVCGPVVDGTSCDDGNLCTQSASCESGACVGADPVVCVTQSECLKSSTCNPSSGTCGTVGLPNGTPCSLGTCQGAVCTDVQVEADGGQPDAGPGPGPATEAEEDEGGCGCRLEASRGARAKALMLAWLAFILLALGVRRRASDTQRT